MRLLVLAVLSTSFLCACGIDSAPGAASGGASAGGTGGSIDSSGGTSSGGSAAGGSATVDRSCVSSTDCVLTSLSCCGTCGVPSASDMIAVRAGQESVYAASVCGSDTLCPACAAAENPNLFAVCESGVCQARDLSAEKASACSTDEDCIVKPRACCECGAGAEPWNLVALNHQSTSYLTDALCEPNAACAECAWIAPSGVAALCENGSCRVNDTRPYPY